MQDLSLRDQCIPIAPDSEQYPPVETVFRPLPLVGRRSVLEASKAEYVSSQVFNALKYAKLTPRRILRSGTWQSPLDPPPASVPASRARAYEKSVPLPCPEVSANAPPETPGAATVRGSRRRAASSPLSDPQVFLVRAAVLKLRTSTRSVRAKGRPSTVYVKYHLVFDVHSTHGGAVPVLRAGSPGGSQLLDCRSRA